MDRWEISFTGRKTTGCKLDVNEGWCVILLKKFLEPFEEYNL